LFISNGPGDPAAVDRTIATLREVINARRRTGNFRFSASASGTSLLSLAIGAKTYKLKFGHRGANQPVHNRISGRVEITSQNHGFAVDPVVPGSRGRRSHPSSPQRQHRRGVPGDGSSDLLGAVSP
jgi:carbamoyl-phosphate synthase small subunit